MRLAETKHELREYGNLKRSTRQFRVSRVLIAAKRVPSVNKKKKPIAQCCRLCHLIHQLENNSTEQPFVSSSPRHIIFLLIITLLIGLLQVDYQNKSVSPFDTHPVNMWISFGAALIYCLGLAINVESKEHQASYSQIHGHVILSSGAHSLRPRSQFLPTLAWVDLFGLMDTFAYYTVKRSLSARSRPLKFRFDPPLIARGHRPFLNIRRRSRS
ncbi:hypothetical protein CUMW_098410 [Citrus unshiu]|uniref:Uncharacterized protein n=1 Tax=Citrus unshiu TaxID=55188 RepID=A0A2H5P2M0_CITUN|nr:hypothetical protein CUMW_098410 [Citrus unshiu]